MADHQSSSDELRDRAARCKFLRGATNEGTKPPTVRAFTCSCVVRGHPRAIQFYKYKHFIRRIKIEDF